MADAFKARIDLRVWCGGLGVGGFCLIIDGRLIAVAIAYFIVDGRLFMVNIALYKNHSPIIYNPLLFESA